MWTKYPQQRLFLMFSLLRNKKKNFLQNFRKLYLYEVILICILIRIM